MNNYTALILAGGRGRRLGELTNNTTKPMVEVCGKKLIEHALDFVKDAGATNIIVLGRYFFKEMEKAVKTYMPEARVVKLPEPDYQTLTDVKAGLQLIKDGGVIICNADYVNKQKTAKVIRGHLNGINIYASFDTSGDAEDVMKVRVNKNGFLEDVSKTLKAYNGIYSGDMSCSYEYLDIFKEAVKNGLKNNPKDKAVTEHSFPELIKLGAPLKVVDVGKADWFEIDTPEELEKAEQALREAGSKERVICNLCSYTASRQVYSLGQLRAVICNNCSLVYLNPRMTDDEYKKYYEDQYQKERHDLELFNDAVLHLEKKDSKGRKRRRLDYIKEYITKDSSVLEVGAGMGTLLALIRDEIGAIVEGIEVGLLASRVAKEHYNVPVTQTTLSEYVKEGGDGQFDFIIMNHVLEHFLDPRLSLGQLHSLLKDDGKVYIAVPNIAAPDEPLDRFFRIPHTYYFSPRTLVDMLHTAGFTVIRLDIDKQETRAIAVKSERGEEGVNTANFVSLYSAQNIERILKRQEKKYAILRNLKHFANIILPVHVFNLVRSCVLRILRKFNIIKV